MAQMLDAAPTSVTMTSTPKLVARGQREGLANLAQPLV